MLQSSIDAELVRSLKVWVEHYAERAEEATRHRDEAMRDLKRAGESTPEIARAAHLSVSTTRRILGTTPQPP